MGRVFICFLNSLRLSLRLRILWKERICLLHKYFVNLYMSRYTVLNPYKPSFISNLLPQTSWLEICPHSKWFWANGYERENDGGRTALMPWIYHWPAHYQLSLKRVHTRLSGYHGYLYLNKILSNLWKCKIVGRRGGGILCTIIVYSLMIILFVMTLPNQPSRNHWPCWKEYP